MKIIGIITRKSVSEEKHNIDYLYSNIVKILYKYEVIPIGVVLNENYKKIIDICDGIIFQGGDSFQEYDVEALLYCYKKDIPTLGICLGMQLMGCVFGGELISVEGHKNRHHEIVIDKKSKLYNIFNKEIIKVNSRHKYVLKNTSLKITSRSNEGYIESIEDSNKRFFIGVQWHPEDMEQLEIFQKLIDSYY